MNGEAKRRDQVTDEQQIRVVSVDFRTEHRPDRAAALARLLFKPTDQDDHDPVPPPAA